MFWCWRIHTRKWLQKDLQRSVVQMQEERLERLANRLYEHYHAKLVAEADGMWRVHHSHETLKEQPVSIQLSFRKAALSCAGVGALSRDWVESQFVMFESYKAWIGKLIFPQPSQIHGMGAQARYMQWKTEQRDDVVREKRKDKTVVKALVLEERNLKALCRSMRLNPTDVLIEKCDEFSIGFLKDKGVYRVVKKRRQELRGEA